MGTAETQPQGTHQVGPVVLLAEDNHVSVTTKATSQKLAHNSQWHVGSNKSIGKSEWLVNLSARHKGHWVDFVDGLSEMIWDVEPSPHEKGPLVLLFGQNMFIEIEKITLFETYMYREWESSLRN
jgi:hypothetical protein